MPGAFTPDFGEGRPRGPQANMDAACLPDAGVLISPLTGIKAFHAI